MCNNKNLPFLNRTSVFINILFRVSWLFMNDNISNHLFSNFLNRITCVLFHSVPQNSNTNRLRFRICIRILFSHLDIIIKNLNFYDVLQILVRSNNSLETPFHRKNWFLWRTLHQKIFVGTDGIMRAWYYDYYVIRQI